MSQVQTFKGGAASSDVAMYLRTGSVPEKPRKGSLSGAHGSGTPRRRTRVRTVCIARDSRLLLEVSG